MKITLLVLIGVMCLFLTLPLRAQMWGTGMMGGFQSCNQMMMPQMQMPQMQQTGQMGQMAQRGGGAPEQDEEITEMQKDLREAKSELSRAKSNISRLKTQVSAKRDLFKLTGFEGEVFSEIEQGVSQSENKKFQKILHCKHTTDRSQSYNASSCQTHLQDWIEKQRELKSEEIKVVELGAKVKEQEALLKAKRAELREAKRDRSKTEAGCVECQMMAGKGGPGGGDSSAMWQAFGNVALGIGSMYMNYQNNKYIANQNAANGFATPSMSLGYGYPYMSGNVYGGMGCGNSMGMMGMSGGYGYGSYGMNSMWNSTMYRATTPTFTGYTYTGPGVPIGFPSSR